MAKSVVDVAIANIDAQIADLNRAKELILGAASTAEPAAATKPRKPRKPRGLPADTGI